jgi:hypothetical protein
LVLLEMPDALVQRRLMAWPALFGTVSFELFGRERQLSHQRLRTHVVGPCQGREDPFPA